MTNWTRKQDKNFNGTFKPSLSETEIYNPQGNQILKKSIYCPILENNRENILIIHMIEGENKGNKGKEKIAYRQTKLHHLSYQQEQQALNCQAPKNNFSEIVSHAPTIAKVA